MRAAELAEATTHLPWLSPDAAALLALARSPVTASWGEVRTDPGAVLLLLRHAKAALNSPGLSFFPALLHDPAILDGAIAHLQHSAAVFVDWSLPATRPVHASALVCARLAHHLAGKTGRCDPDNAWVAGLFAPLGWLAVCAVDPGEAASCRADPAFARQPIATQRRCWGLDQSAIARRLARRWSLPPWLSACAGHLGLHAETAQRFGADHALFLIVQLAVGLAYKHGIDLGLVVGTSPAAAWTALAVPATHREALEHEAHALVEATSPPRVWSPPASLPLLGDLLRLAAENRRLLDAPLLDHLESDIDDLHRALEEQQAGEAARLQGQKLNALAEFAGGAGHEINNPLAVISGQAQYLLKQLQKVESSSMESPGQSPGLVPPGLSVSNLQSVLRSSLETIIAQTQRIHHLLRDLMQFARPPRPHKQSIDLTDLVREVTTSLSELASERRVTLIADGTFPVTDAAEPTVLRAPQPVILVHVDPIQVRSALTCLLRNAIEAAPADGWASIRMDTSAPDQVEVVVEDNGGGPEAPQREHLFDPFYSGRQAGRGRGLGLPTAWRLAREQGGDVRFAGQPAGPTRFILSLPRESVSNHVPPMRLTG